MAQHNETGASGELVAVNHLLEQGYDIIEKNWRSGKDEVDVIAMHKDQLVFVEVKTRTSDFFGAPEEWVGIKKQRNLIRAANSYIEERNLALNVRFDVIGIIKSNNQLRLNHIEDAFYPLA